MKERPILFSAPMVRAILDGRKTQTRRLVKPQPDSIGSGADLEFDHEGWCVTLGPKKYTEQFSPYQVGGRLWVREAWRSWVERHEEEDDDGQGYEVFEQTYVAYRATPREGYRPVPDKARITYLDERTPLECNPKLLGPWKPGIHMPRAFSRLLLEVTEVRVERVQSISEADAQAEGVEDRASFERLWHEINGAESWNANPFVWVVEFRRLP